MNLVTTLQRAGRRIAAFDVPEGVRAELRRLSRSPIDLVVGVGLAAITLITSYDQAVGAVAAMQLATAPQAVRRARPWLAIGLTLVGGLLIVAVHPIIGLWVVPVLVSGAISYYTLQRLLGRRSAWLLCGLLVAVVLLGCGFLYVRHYPPEIVGAAFLASSAFLIGATLVADLRRSRTEVRRVKADNLETLREQAAMAERARIAREMHDIVAHSISMIAVQAEAAPYAIRDLGDAAKREFAEIAAAARGTLTEMRRLLGVLRADVPPETAPQPGLARLGELIERHDGEVDLDIIGDVRELPPAVDVSAYRIIQEALTNVRKHAPGARVSIEIAYRPALLALRIADDGPGPAGRGSGETAEATGHGLIGMRERAAALGGWFVAEPGPGGGFVIRAGLPTE